jgi:hypothetical protein
MKQLLLSLLFCISCTGFAPFPKTPESIVGISWRGEGPEGQTIGMQCTGFAVGISWVVSAGHCAPPGNEDVYVDGQLARRIKSNMAFLLLEVPAGKYPILQLSKNRPKIGDEVYAYGFAYGMPLQVYTRHVASICGCRYSTEDHLVMDGSVSPGMSGGPILDVNGKVVGMNQANAGELSIGCLSEELKDFLK